ncbi:MAG: pyruvate:ferredoxin (flavodoxin) oxidoreductase, partial [Oscillospiraceae bacterium]
MTRKMKTMDGNTAAAHVSYAFTDVAAIYPITPSSPMADITDVWSSEGKKNVFSKPVQVVEMQSEAGAAGAVHGSLTAGALTTTYTASQGLLLMIPNMYKIAGELLPSVINVSARTIASHALSIFGDHQDIYAARQTGYAMLCSTNPQEAMDLAAVAHLSTYPSRVPFVHFFDGFRTSHEIQKVAQWEYEDLKEMLDIDAVDAFRKRSLNPEHPTLRGTVQNDDIFFQARESSNKFYQETPRIVEEYMSKVNSKLGTEYALFNYYGAKDAEHIIIAMGSVNDTIEETIDFLAKQGQKIGLVKVRLYRPFSSKHLINAIPDSVKSISVLDRTKEPGAVGEPLYLDVVASLKGSKFDKLPIYGGRYGLASKDTLPTHISSVYNNARSNNPKTMFTLSIVDDVTHLSLDITDDFDSAPEGTTSCKFWGLGSDGTVGANKNTIKIIGDKTDLNVQAYFAYDSKKSGGITTSHLRFGKSAIKSTYLVNKADFVACHNPSYVDKYDMLKDLKKGGVFLLNCPWDVKGLEENLPGDTKAYIANNDIKIYTIDGVEIARQIGLGQRINTILQSAFFQLTGIIDPEKAKQYMKDAAEKSYSKKGEKVVKMNFDAIDRGMADVVKVEVPESWKKESGAIVEELFDGREELKGFVKDLVLPINAQKGYDLPVSAFTGREDGTFPQGTAAFEKRGIAIDVPEWDFDNCIQCNFCSYVCPHGVIRPVVLTEEEAKTAPKDMKLMDMTGMPGYKFGISVSALDCTGCSSCAHVCPGKKGNKALVMKPLDTQMAEQENFDFGVKFDPKPEVLAKFKSSTVKGSQFLTPLLEFSGACAGCGETPYAKLATQLYGDRMYIANATGCSSIWGASAPATPYTVNSKGFGPAWGNSLFEDNAEFGYGMYLAQRTLRDRQLSRVQELIKLSSISEELKECCQEYLDTYNDGSRNKYSTERLVIQLEKATEELAKDILKEKDYLSKKSVWI